ncbi:hypothetical protein [Streptomyces sp. NPDC089919]|uniref:hypothetical protein n=1 Tax=Streptomyces sp. NPDC089919 TaxID=3155188 RepID=UPI0034292BC4
MLLDLYVPLGPDQAARRLGVRRTDFDHVVRIGLVAPTGSAEVDYGKAAGGVTTVPLYNAQDVALLPVMARSVDWRAVALIGPGRRSPLAGLAPVEGPRTLFLAAVARIAGVGRAAVVAWRRRHLDFPPAVGGTDVSPTFDTAAVVAWLLAHDKVAVPVAEPTGTLLLAAGFRGTRRFRLEDPYLETAAEAGGEDRVVAWFTDAGAEEVTTFTVRATGAAVNSLTVPGRTPLAVPGGARFAPPPVLQHLTLAWPAGLRGTAAGSGGGVVRHGVPDAAPGPVRAAIPTRCRRARSRVRRWRPTRSSSSASCTGAYQPGRRGLVPGVDEGHHRPREGTR